MRPIIIGAGRGRRLNALTERQPKCYAEVGGKRILDWLLEALQDAGLESPVFVGGYQIDLIREDYPHLQFCHNEAWPNNNILASLFYAEDHMHDGFVCSYAGHPLSGQRRAPGAGAPRGHGLVRRQRLAQTL